MYPGKFYSKGKFLLSGEYAVLYGAEALAVPLKFGQRMVVEEIPDPGILQWETFVMDQPWFRARFDKEKFDTLSSTDERISSFIKRLLVNASDLQPELKEPATGFMIRNYIDFDIRWGLGSSSSLLSNLAYWLDIDPFTLYKKTFNGSGYDIFCARSETPLLYKLKKGSPVAHIAQLDWPFTGQIYFIYLGKKQDSQLSVKNFLAGKNVDEHILVTISGLTEQLMNASSIGEFQESMKSHEEIMSTVLGIKPVKTAQFPDFEGEIKSLGAWGGDFIMAATIHDRGYVVDYFARKQMPVIFGWNEIVYDDQISGMI